MSEVIHMVSYEKHVTCCMFIESDSLFCEQAHWIVKLSCFIIYYHGNTLQGQKNGVYAFGYNCAENEAIWMKSGHSEHIVRGMALSDFGRTRMRDPRHIAP